MARELKNIIIGFCLLLLSFLTFLVFSVWIVLSKMLTIEGNSFSEFLENDKTLCLFVPLLIPFTFIWFYFKWIAYHYFKRC